MSKSILFLSFQTYKRYMKHLHKLDSLTSIYIVMPWNFVATLLNGTCSLVETEDDVVTSILV